MAEGHSRKLDDPMGQEGKKQTTGPKSLLNGDQQRANPQE